MASTASARQNKNVRNFQSQTTRTKVKWNTQHQVNMPPRNQSISPLQQSPTPSATNHINAPSISSAPNTSLKPLEVPIHDEVSAKHMHDRMLCLLANFVGMNVQVTVKNGTKYEGLFHTAATEGELGVVLKFARKVLTKAEERTATANRFYKSIIINPKDCMAIEATGIDFSSSEKSVTTEREGFRTDTDISGRVEIRERELHKWTPDEHGGGEVLGGLEDDCTPEAGNGAAWDQFAANEQLFGLKTDFDEEIYTTKLDRSRADFKEREKQAIQIANEITRTQTTNIHMLEERGYLVEDSHMDEEDRYGAVVRNRDPSKYMPPALRKMQEQQNATTCKKPEPIKEPVKEDKSKPAPEAKPSTGSTPAQQNASIQKIPTLNQHSLAQYRISSDVTQLLNSHAQRKPGTDAHGKPIEAQIMNTFKQFASNEKERLQQRKQAIFKKEMHGKVAELAEWGKTFKLNSPLPSDLIPILTKDEGKRQQLAAKSTVTVPSNEKDTKNKEKQQKETFKEKEKERTREREKPKIIIADTSDVKTETKKSESKIEEKPKSNSEPIEPKSTSDKTTSDKSPTHQNDKSPSIFPPNRSPTSFKLNAKASEWRPNPNAATFTPTTPTSTADKRSPGSSPFFGNKQLKKSPVSLKDSFSPFQKKPLPNPSTIPPTWPFGQRPFRHQFTVTTAFEEDIYTQAAVSPGYGFAPYPVGPPFRFPAAAQYVGVPPMTMQQTAPMPYMQPGFVPSMPFTTPPLPATGAPPQMYSPQIPSVMPPQPFNAQGFPSPGRSHMVPSMHPQMYAAYQNPHTIPLMRYPHENMPIHVPPNGVMTNNVMIGQRPMMMDPHYAQPEGAPMEGIPVSEPATTQ